MNTCLRVACTKYQRTATMLSRFVASELGLGLKVRPFMSSRTTFFINLNVMPVHYGYSVGTNSISNHVHIRTKTTKRSKAKDSKDDEEEDELDTEQSDEIDDAGRDYKDINTLVNSLRIDNIIKAGLGITKSKVEDAFYESKIRLNGEKIMKKSTLVNVGDEVDLIKGQNLNNLKFTDVSRIILKEVGDKSTHDKLKVTLRRFKNLTVDAYQE